MITGLEFQLLYNKQNMIALLQSFSSSDDAVPLVKALKHCNKIEHIFLVGNFSGGMRSASILKEELQYCSQLKVFSFVRIFYKTLNVRTTLQHFKSL